jgi:hypothetical protein
MPTVSLSQDAISRISSSTSEDINQINNPIGAASRLCEAGSYSRRGTGGCRALQLADGVRDISRRALSIQQLASHSISTIEDLKNVEASAVTLFLTLMR